MYMYIYKYTYVVYIHEHIRVLPPRKLAILGGCQRQVFWLRLVGSSKLQVSFAEYSLFYRALLQKRHIVLRSLPVGATQ